MRPLLALVSLAVLFAAPVGAETETTEVTPRSGAVAVVAIDGAINSASARHVLDAIEQAEAKGAVVLILEMDTPGGLVISTKEIIQGMLNSSVPIVVFVRPQGAWASSAGALLTIAGHVAVMSPGSTIGAAHPVSVGAPNPKGPTDEEGNSAPADYGVEKAENLIASYIRGVAEERGRNAEWAEQSVRQSVAATAEEAVELNIIDFIAEDRADLLKQLNGREIKLGKKRVRLEVPQGPVIDIEMPLVTQFFHWLEHPEIVGLLMLLGMLGVYFEYNNPGTIIAGAAGAICLLLGLIAMQAIPFSWTGVVFCAIGLGLMVAEAFVPAYGVALLLGAVFLLVGGSMIFDRPDVSDLTIDFWSVLVPLVAGLTACMGAIVVAVGRTVGLAQVAGVGELIGLHGVAKTALAPQGTVFLRGEHWTAYSAEEIPADARVEAVAVDGMRLEVKRADD